MFMTTAQRKAKRAQELQQQREEEERKQQQQQQQQQLLLSAAAAAAAAAATGKLPAEATVVERRGPPAAAVHPFFSGRMAKQQGLPTEGALAPTAAAALWQQQQQQQVKKRAPPLAPVHITQAEAQGAVPTVLRPLDAADLLSLLLHKSKQQQQQQQQQQHEALDDSSTCAVTVTADRVDDCRCWSLRHNCTGPDALAIQAVQQQQQGFQDLQNAAAQGTSPLLLELALHLNRQAAAAAGATAEVEAALLDIPTPLDYLLQLLQELQQLQQLAVANSSCVSVGTSLQESAMPAAAAAASAAVNLPDGCPASTGAAGAAGRSDSLLWSVKYAPAAAAHMCGNAAAVCSFKQFLQDWKGIIQQQQQQQQPAAGTDDDAITATAAVVKAANRGRGFLDTESEQSSWAQSTRTFGLSSLQDEGTPGRCGGHDDTWKHADG
jgi:hypothetical protein